MAKLEVSNSSMEDFVKGTTTLTLRHLSDEELKQICDKLDELGWVKVDPFVVKP